MGLRELGIASEFGLSSLTIPKRLLKGKRNAKGPNAAYELVFLYPALNSILTHSHSSKSAEPPPPYPPPSLLISLTMESVKSQVGLLRGYFEHRLASAGLDTLSDDSPNPAQAKLGPLGQVIRPSSAAIAAAAGSKKKAKPKDATAPTAAATAATTTALAPTVGPATAAAVGSAAPGVTVGVIPGVAAGVVQPTTPVLSSPSLLSQLGGSMIPPAATMAPVTAAVGDPQPQSQTPKKKKATPGAGAGAGGAGGTGAGTVGGPGGGSTNKKRGRPPEGLPPVVLASA